MRNAAMPRRNLEHSSSGMPRAAECDHAARSSQRRYTALFTCPYSSMSSDATSSDTTWGCGCSQASCMTRVYESRVLITPETRGARVPRIQIREGFMKRTMLALALCFAVRCAVAGVYVEVFDHDVKTGSSELAQKMYVQAGNGRFVDPDGRTTLIKGDTMYVLDDSDKTYIALDKATMEQLAKKISAAMDKAKEQLAKLPPEQRAQAEAMMGGALGGASGAEGADKHTVEALDTGKSDKVEGR